MPIALIDEAAAAEFRHILPTRHLAPPVFAAKRLAVAAVIARHNTPSPRFRRRATACDEMSRHDTRHYRHEPPRGHHVYRPPGHHATGTSIASRHYRRRRHATVYFRLWPPVRLATPIDAPTRIRPPDVTWH